MLTKKQQFILAYMWLFGVSRWRATRIYMESTTPYIDEVIKLYEDHCRKIFKED